MLSTEQIRKLPKVALHEHLDGGLRPQTVIDHCREAGHELPSHDAEELRTWFFRQLRQGLAGLCAHGRRSPVRADHHPALADIPGR